MKNNLLLIILISLFLCACNENQQSSNIPQKTDTNGLEQPDETDDSSEQDDNITSIVIVTASGDDGKGNIADNVLDNDFDTRWSAESINNVNAWLTIDLGQVQTIYGIQLSFYKGDKRSSKFTIELSDDGNNWSKKLASISSSGETLSLENFEFDDATEARYIRYTGEGNSSGSGWNSITKFIVTTNQSTADNEEGTADNEDDTSTEYGLYTTLAPSDNFDLSHWNLSAPIDNGEGDGYAKATTVTVEELNDEYQHADYFWTDTSDGGMVFKDYIDGARTSENTTYTRTELREMLRGEDTSISTQGVNGNNWVFSSVPQALQDKAGGVDGNMVATLAVNHVTTTGKDSYVGRVIVGQIHAASDEPIRLYYRLLPGHTKGSIYFAHEPSNGNSEQWYEMIGSKDDDADEPTDGIELDEKFSYEIDIAGDIMTVTITREDGSTIEKEVNMSNSGYSDGYYDKENDDGVDDTEDYMYFKAGVYNQNKLVDVKDEDGNDVDGGDGIDDYDAEADDYVQATFYYLAVSH